MAEAKTAKAETAAAKEPETAPDEVQLQGPSDEAPDELGNNYNYFATKGYVQAALSEDGTGYTVVEGTGEDRKVTTVPAEEFDAKYEVVQPKFLGPTD